MHTFSASPSTLDENTVEFSDIQKINQKDNVMYPEESLDSDEEPVQASQENPITAIVDIETVPTKGNIIKSSAVNNEQSLFDRITMIRSDSKYKTNKTHPSSKYIQVLEINQREEEHCIMHMKDYVDRHEDEIVVLETEFITIVEKSQFNSEEREINENSNNLKSHQNGNKNEGSKTKDKESKPECEESSFCPIVECTVLLILFSVLFMYMYLLFIPFISS